MSCTSSGMMTSLKFRRSSGSGKSIWHVFGRFRSARSKEHDFFGGSFDNQEKTWCLVTSLSVFSSRRRWSSSNSEQCSHPWTAASERRVLSSSALRRALWFLRPSSSDLRTWWMYCAGIGGDVCCAGLGGRWYIGEMRWVPGAFQGVWLGYPSMHEAVSVWSTQMLRRLVGYIEQRRLLHVMRHFRIVFKNSVFNAKKGSTVVQLYLYLETSDRQE